MLHSVFKILLNMFISQIPILHMHHELNQVKLQYRKAMLVVHPDRCSGLSAEIRFIAKRVFEAINEAYQEFLKKESV